MCKENLNRELEEKIETLDFLVNKNDEFIKKAKEISERDDIGDGLKSFLLETLKDTEFQNDKLKELLDIDKKIVEEIK